MKMTAQEAFHKILTEQGAPMTPMELATIAISKGYVSSNAKNAPFSIASTVTKNIRGGTYNHPQLVKIGRKLGLPSMQKNSHSTNEAEHNKKKTLSVEIPEEIADKIQLAKQAKLAESLDETVVLLLNAGLSAYAEEIRKNLLQQLNAI
jgi:hypothetical protein